VLGEDHVKAARAGGGAFQSAADPLGVACQRGRVEEVLEVAQARVASHLPEGERVDHHAEPAGDRGGVGEVGTQEVDLVSATDELLHEVGRLGGAAPAGRMEGLMGQERDAHGGEGSWAGRGCRFRIRPVPAGSG
jgi:hypothetical protein